MNEQKEFFSTKHKQLLSISTWAKYLAWAVLFIYSVRTMLVIFQHQANYRQMQATMSSTQGGLDYWEMVRRDLVYYLIDIGSDMVGLLIRGFVLYVVLKGISLGLSMIVETDINFREKGYDGGAE